MAAARAKPGDVGSNRHRLDRGSPPKPKLPLSGSGSRHGGVAATWTLPPTPGSSLLGTGSLATLSEPEKTTGQGEQRRDPQEGVAAGGSSDPEEHKVCTRGAERVTLPVTPPTAHTLFSSRTTEIVMGVFFFNWHHPRKFLMSWKFINYSLI